MAVLFALACNGGVAQTLVDQSVFVVEENGTPISISNDEFYQTETGYLYTSDFLMVTDFLGTIATVQYEMEVELGHDYAIVAARQERKLGDQQTEFDLTVDYNSPEPLVYITITEQGTSRTEIHVLEPGQKLYYPDPALFMIAASGGMIPGQEYAFLFLQSTEFTLAPGSFLIGDYGTYTIADEHFEGYYVQFTLQDLLSFDMYADEAGRVYYNTSTDLSEIVGRRIEDEELPELTALPVELTTLEANLFVAHPYRSIRTRLSISIQDLAAVQLEDNRQRIIEQKASDGKHQVLVEINKDNRSHSGKYQLPITGSEWEPFLGSDRYIDPTLPEIQQLVTEILQGETDAWQSVAKLVKWVFEYLDATATIIPKNTAQILADPAGNCKEHAILFAALARAAGIPTRVALGLRYYGGYWIGHMWNEVWIGEWIAVDPGYGQIAPDAMLVKLIDQDSAAGLITRAGHTLSNTELAIKLVDTLSRRPKGPMETGVSGQTFTNAEFAFSITIPDQWSFLLVDDQSFSALADNQLASVIVEVYTLVSGIDLQRLMKYQLESAFQALPEYIVYGPDDIEIRVIDGYEAFTASWGLELEDLMIYQELVMLMIDDMCYTVAFTVPAMFYDHFSATFEQILDSIQIHW